MTRRICPPLFAALLLAGAPALRAQPLTVGQKVTFRCQQSTTATGTASSSSSSSVASSSSSSSTAATWVHCSNEGSLCAFTGSRSVRFGLGSTWDTRTFTGGVQCSTTYFADPAPGQTKTCQIGGTSSSSSTSSASTSSASSSAPTVAAVTLNWTEPTKNTDGSALTDLTGYKIYYGTSTSSLTSFVTAGRVTTYTVPGLATGQMWYFAIASVSTSGGDGSKSNPASKVL